MMIYGIYRTIIELVRIDANPGMATAAFIELFTWSGLNQEQYDRLVNRPEFALPFCQKYHRNKLMKIEIDSKPLSDKLIEKCILAYDGQIQIYLLNKNEINRLQLEYIFQHGKNKAVRNIAKDMLRKRRYQ
jgi:hypothetical protein